MIFFLSLVGGVSVTRAGQKRDDIANIRMLIADGINMSLGCNQTDIRLSFVDKGTDNYLIFGRFTDL
jgi:hypothetical protein